MVIKSDKKCNTIIIEIDRIEAFNMIEKLLSTLKQTEISNSHCFFIDYKNNKEVLVTIDREVQK